MRRFKKIKFNFKGVLYFKPQVKMMPAYPAFEKETASMIFLTKISSL